MLQVCQIQITTKVVWWWCCAFAHLRRNTACQSCAVWCCLAQNAHHLHSSKCAFGALRLAYTFLGGRL